MLGPNLGIDSPEFLIKADVLCDEYGIDTISAGGTIGLAIDMYERGVLTKEDADGMELRWGDPDTVLELLRLIGERQGDFAERLGEGSRRLAERYGVPELAPHSKGQEFPAYDPRGAQGFALQYATSNRGACHLTASVFSAEITSGKIDRFATEGKAKLVRDAAIFVAFIDCGVFCLFMRYVLTMDDILEFFKTATGRALSNDDANVIGERIYTLERLINIGQGMTREQDTLPEKFLSQPLPRGSSEGQVVRLSEMLGEYYDLMEYDESGMPTAQALNRLGLTEEAKKV
jgi:aldehyde:ferredoxin oxidoreductase